MRYFLVLFITVGTVFQSLQAQQLYVEKGRLLEVEPYFNADFIKKQDIKAIYAEYAFKDEFSPIASTRIFRRYEFNLNGRLKRFVETYDLGYKLDSTEIVYTYNAQGLVAKKQVKDVFGQYYYVFKYDRHQRLIESCYGRPKPYEQADEVKTITYQEYPQQVKMQWFNPSGRLFKEEQIVHDSLGLVASKTETMAIGSQQNAEYYQYQNNGLIKCVVLEAIPQNNTVKYEYVFDDNGNPEKEIVTRNEQPLSKKEFLYRDGLIYAHLEKDELTSRIKIWEYDYEFFGFRN